MLQIGFVALGLFLYHLFLGGTGIEPGDAITLWATVITIVFVVLSVLGLMNIDAKIKSLLRQKGVSQEIPVLGRGEKYE